MQHLIRGFAAVIATILIGSGVSAETDLDAFMRRVLSRRDENWKKLQQYILDERERIDVRGPGRIPIWAEHREYTWYIRDGFFVRSPVKFNGVSIAESERRRFEADYLKRQQARERRQRRGQASDPVSVPEAAQPGPEQAAGVDAAEIGSLLTQTRQPEFISSAYFLRFRFDEGRYAFVGRETLGGRGVLRIEYYPTKLFRGTGRRRNREGTTDRDRAYDAQFQRMLNKVALVTLWVEPDAHQIVKYTFSNLPVDFLPLPWLAHLDSLEATMTMGQPFADVWLPSDLAFDVALTLAIGRVDVRYTIAYHDYRVPDVATKVTIR
jgi:hypothetical protein